MGWHFQWPPQSRADLISDLVSDSHVLQHCAQGNILWTLEQGKSEPYIGCYILCQDECNTSSTAGGWGYKPLDESFHPYYYTCPPSYLEVAPEVDAAWREGVRAYHDLKRRRSA